MMIRYILSSLLILLTVVTHAQLQRDSVITILDLSAHASVQMADVDGDSDIDLIVNQRGYNGNFMLYENVGGADHFAPGRAFGEKHWEDLPDVTTNFNLGDMDNDGDPDIVSGNILKAALPYRLNDGTGQFPFSPDDYVQYYDGQRDYHRQELTDLGADGDLDIVMFKTGAFEIHINQNNGTGNDFELQEDIELDEPLSNSFRGWTILDFDQDGDKDIAYVVQTSGIEQKQLQLVILEQSCTYCFEEVSRLQLEDIYGFLGTATLEAVLMDDDEFPDLVMHYQAYTNNGEEDVDSRDIFRILKNDEGNGQFIPVVHEYDYAAFSINDLDGDNDLDLVLAYDSDMDSGSGADLIYHKKINEGDFQFATTLIDEIDTGDILHLLDLNQDDALDILTLETDGHIIVRWGLENGLFSQPESQNAVNERSSVFTSVDWDQDGDLDIVSVGKTLVDGLSSNGAFWNENDGDGNFGPLNLIRSLNDNYSTDQVQLEDANQDGLPDVFIVEVINTEEDGQYQILNLYLSDGNGQYMDGIAVAPIHGTRVNDFDLGDIDLDGDIDVLFVDRVEDQIWTVWNQLNEGNGLVAEMTNITYGQSSYYSVDINVVDINGDLRPDVFFSVSGDYYWAIKSEEGALYEELKLFDFMGDAYIYTPRIDTRLDADQAAEFLFQSKIGQGYIHTFRSDFDMEADSFLMPIITQYGIANVVYSTILFDANEDGLLDIVDQRGFGLNIPNSFYFTTPYSPSPFEENLIGDLFWNGHLADLDGDENNEIVAGFYSLNYYENDFLNGRNVQGYVRWDETAECQSHDQIPGLEGWNVAINHADGSQLSRTVTDGHYASFLPFDGEYVLRPVLPSGYWTSCPADSIIQINEGQEIEEVNFSAEALVDCPLVVIDLSSTDISQCFTSSVSIAYYNAGTASAYEVAIELTFDGRLLPISSNIDWGTQTDTSLIFNFDEIAVGERGFISINFEPDCSALILDELLCFSATITPGELCDEMLFQWSGANIEASPICEEGSTGFRIVNTGTNAMDMAEQYRVSIVNDDIILYLSDDVILDPSEADTIWLPELEEGHWHLGINQPQGHPFPEPISLSSFGCTTDGQIPNLLPDGDGDPFRELLCRPVMGPFDPNDKSATPIGVGLENEIEKDWELTYTIQFQNVGNDRARTVTLQDQLSEWLDLSTFKPIAASHDYDWTILDPRQLIVTFPEINLPDSTSNEQGSHGFFTFAITPKTGIPVETVINNYADIYFDLNPPIRTGVVSHKIKKPVHAAAIHDELCAGEAYQDQIILQDTMLQQTIAFMEYDSITFYYLTVLPSPIVTEEISFSESFLWEGIQVNNDTIIERVYTNTVGCDSTQVFQFTLVNSTSKINSKAYSLSPNPARSFTALEIANQYSYPDLLELRTVEGKLIKKWQPTLIPNGSLKIDTNELLPATYLLHVWKGDGKVVLPLIVVR